MRVLSVILCLAALHAQAQVPPFTSVRTAAGTRPNSGNAIASDNVGNLYIAGSFGSILQVGSIDFGTTNLVSQGDTDGFLAKFDVQGRCLWARQMAGIDQNDAYDVIVRSDGTILVAGEFLGTNTIGNTNLVSLGGYDIFLAAFSAAGDLLWARATGGSMHDFAIALAAGPDASTFFTGSFAGGINLDGTNFVSADEDALLLRLAADGKVQWAVRAGGAGYQFGSDIKLDAQANTYWVGEFETNIVLGATTLTSPGVNVFMAKYDPAGNQVWARKLGDGQDAQLPRIALSPGGGMVCTAVYDGAYAIGAQTLPTGVSDVLIARFNAAAELQWVRTFGGNELDVCNELLIDPSGDCFLAGYFRGIMTVGNSNLTSAGSTDIFLARCSSAGQLQGATLAGGSAPDVAFSALIGTAGEIRVTGSFAATAQFGGLSVSSSDGLAKMFMATLSYPPTLRIASSPPDVLLSWPAHFSDLKLQTASELSASSWDPVSTVPTLVGADLVVTNQTSGPARFFRLGN